MKRLERTIRHRQALLFWIRILGIAFALSGVYLIYEGSRSGVYALDIMGVCLFTVSLSFQLIHAGIRIHHLERELNKYKDWTLTLMQWRIQIEGDSSRTDRKEKSDETDP